MILATAKSGTVTAEPILRTIQAESIATIEISGNWVSSVSHANIIFYEEALSINI